MSFQSIALLFISFFIASSCTSTIDNGVDFVGFHTVATLPRKLSDMVAVSFQENIFNDDNGPRIYLTGGCVSDQMCNVDSITGALTCYCPTVTNATVYFIPEQLKWFSAANMNGQRYRHMSAKVGNYLYVAGGRYVNDSLISTVERYDPLSNQWKIMWSWPTPTSDGVAFGFESTLYIAGGYDASYNSPGYLYAIDVNTGSITQRTSMLKGRGDIAVAEFHGLFYIAGGWNMDNFFSQPYGDVEYYNPTTNTWTAVAPMTLPRGDFVLAVMDDSIFAVGGETRPVSDVTHTYSIPVPYAERYLPSNNSWVEEESIPDHLFRFMGVSYNSSTDVYSSAIYLFGGQGMYNNDSDIYPLRNYTIKYIPQSTVHSSGKSDPLTPGGIAGIVIAGVVVLAGIVFCCLVGGGYFVHKHYYSQLTDTDEQQPQASTAAVAAVKGSQKSNNQNSVVTTHNATTTLGKDDGIDLENLELQNAFPSSLQGHNLHETVVF